MGRKKTVTIRMLIIFGLPMTMLNSMKKIPLSIASWNLLHEDFYIRYAKPAPFVRMPLQERTNRFHDIIGQLKNIDVITFQEFGSLALPTSFLQQYTLISGINNFLVT